MSLLLLLRKLIKIIRGDISPRQVGLGVLFGVLVGLPTFGTLTVILLLLFFTLSANLGTFLLAMGLAKALRAVAPGMLDSLGRSLLESESLKGTWHTLLNLPVISTFGLDRYLEMGAVALGLVIGGTGLVSFWMFLGRLRVASTGFVAARPKVSGLFTNKVVRFLVVVLFGKKKDLDPGVKDRWIRTGFAVPAVLLLAGFSSLLWWKGDAWAEAGVEMVAGQITGNEVSVGGTQFKLVGGSLQLSNLLVTRRANASVRTAAAQPGTQQSAEKVAEGQQFKVDLGFAALLDRRMHVEDATVDHFVFHANSEEAPPMPPEPGEDTTGADPETGKTGIDLAKIVKWVDAHEKQLDWALGKIDAFLKKGNEPPDAKAPQYEGCAAYVYARPETPTLVVDHAGVRNLRFDWSGSEGPLTRLQQLDLSIQGLSSNPVLHRDPITLNASGAYGSGSLNITGMLDAREGGADNHKLVIGYQSAKFLGENVLGMAGGKDLDLAIEIDFAPGTRAIRSAQCKGSFAADNPGQVSFALGAGPAKRWDVEVKNLDVQRLAGVRMPKAIGLQKGVIDLKTSLGRDAGKLDGTLSLACRNLELVPGTAKNFAGMDAAKLCQALTEITKKSPLGLSFRVGGTADAPMVSMEDTGVKQLFEDVKKGLIESGKQQLAAEFDSQIGKLTDKLGAELKDKLGDKLPDGAGKLEELLGGEGKKAIDGAKEGASSVLDGLFGGKKKDPKKDDANKPKDDSSKPKDDG